MAMGGACRGAAGRPRRPAYPIKVIICLFIDPIERAVPQLTGIPATAAPTTSGTVRHRRGGPCRTPIARVLDYRDLDIGRVAENPQVRPGIQSTTTGDLSHKTVTLSLTP